MRGTGNPKLKMLQEIYAESPEALLSLARRLGLEKRFVETLAQIRAKQAAQRGKAIEFAAAA